MVRNRLSPVLFAAAVLSLASGGIVVTRGEAQTATTAPNATATQPASSGASPSTPSIDTLKAQVAALQKQVAALQAENTQLRKHVGAASTPFPTTVTPANSNDKDKLTQQMALDRINQRRKTLAGIDAKKKTATTAEGKLFYMDQEDKETEYLRKEIADYNSKFQPPLPTP